MQEKNINIAFPIALPIFPTSENPKNFPLNKLKIKYSTTSRIPIPTQSLFFKLIPSPLNYYSNDRKVIPISIKNKSMPSIGISL